MNVIEAIGNYMVFCMQCSAGASLYDPHPRTTAIGPQYSGEIFSRPLFSNDVF